jgi:hypothetical protein
MSKLTSYRGGQAVAPGALLRIERTAVTYANADTVILNVTSGGAIVDEILIECPFNGTASNTVFIDDIKYTVDGGSEQTLDYNNFIIASANGSGAEGRSYNAFVLPFKLAGNTSVNIKITFGADGTSAATAADVVVQYRIPA